MPGTAVDHIQQASRKYLVLLNVLIIGVPIGTVLYWVFFNSLPDGFVADLPVHPVPKLSARQIALALLVTMLPMSVALHALMTLKALFSLYAKAVVFSAGNVTCFRRLGYALIAWVAATSVFTPLISAVLSYGAAAGERALMAKFGIEEVIMLIIGGVVLVVSWAMSEGCKMKDEQALTV